MSSSNNTNQPQIPTTIPTNQQFNQPQATKSKFFRETKATEWFTVLVSILTLIATLFIQIHVAYDLNTQNHQFQIDQYTTQKNDQLANVQLTDLPPNSSGFGYATSLGFTVTNTGPAAATNIRITTTILTINPNWKKSITDINQFSPELTPPVFNNITYSKLGVAPGQEIQGNNTAVFSINTLPRNGVVEVRFYLPNSLSSQIFKISDNVTLYADTDIVPHLNLSDPLDPTADQLINSYVDNKLNIADLDTSLVCDHCNFGSDYAKHNQLLTPIQFGSTLIEGTDGVIDKDNKNLYQFNRKITIFYQVSNKSEIPMVNSPLYLRAAFVYNSEQQKHQIILECTPNNCV